MKIIFKERKNNFIEKYNYGNGIVGFNEYVVRTVSSCYFECIYCFIKKEKEIILYNNFDKLLKEIIQLRKEVSGKIFLNNGENADSFAFEPYHGAVRFLIENISRLNNVYLELRTKTSNVKHLKNLKHSNKIIVSFSLNPGAFIKKYEKRTASLEERIKAMKTCVDYGYPLGIRFEPVIFTSGWEILYKNLIDEVFENINLKNIHSIGIGTLRLTKELYKKYRKLKKLPDFLGEEFVPCPDGKMRYFRPIRTYIYRKILGFLFNVSGKFFLCKNPFLNENNHKIPVFLSTEPDYIWNDCINL